VAETSDNDALVHVRLPRGQTVEEAVLSQGDLEITLIPDPAQLAVSQFIILDASLTMSDVRDDIIDSVRRLWQIGSQESRRTGLVFYDSDVTILQATNVTDDLDTHLADYTIGDNEATCPVAAFDALNDITRDYDRTWRILLITTGTLSDDCDLDNVLVPSSLDMIAITDELDPSLENLVLSSYGQLYSANSRLVESRINEVVSAWSQATYALRGDIPDGWDSDAEFELNIRTSNNEVSENLSFVSYNVPQPTATPRPTEATPTEVETEETPEVTEAVAVVTDPTAIPADSENVEEPTGDSDRVAVFLIIGAVLFVVGAIVLAVALSRIRRAPRDEPVAKPANASFYETLDAVDRATEQAVTATRVRERGIASRNDDPDTMVGDLDDTRMAPLDDSDEDDEDELLLTQVLTDDRFRSMMENSSQNNEIVGWMRLIVEGQEERDFELTPDGAVVGRSQECNIQVTGDRAISRKHARLDVRANGQVTVSRLSAVNPVVVAGIQISNRHPLAPNDVIHLSDQTRLIFIANEELDDEMDVTQF